MILMIDNYDSFTYNIVQYLGELGANVKVVRNDMISINDIKIMEPEKIIISPGPCTPNEAGISIETINNFYKETPILGVCLGHQSIGAAFGGNIIKAKKIMHGKTSQIHHKQNYIFKDIPTPYIATRYHSLVIEEKTIPSCLEIIAETKSDDQSDNEIMAIRHKDYHTYGVQFHPESIMSEYGHEILKNFLDIK
ncbi:MAG: aminodeoxychorismate/anthranilate synthase component II [Gammaproteobacteria bacterium]|jgi:anthranilate synthase component II|nr:aminodeoxychorismate/anthranilate synthase component II [Gammaproteobacteria bacterium]MBT7603963.1 aminodeoxychorismate/anthranilate synthase component II [Gammaproteobacteria bacterium]